MQATDQQLRQFSPQEDWAVYQATDFVKRPAKAVIGRRRVPAVYRPNVVKTVSLLRLAPIARGRIELAWADVWHMHAIPARARSSAVGYLFQITTSELPQKFLLNPVAFRTSLDLGHRPPRTSKSAWALHGD